jgi:hypothetical protein
MQVLTRFGRMLLLAVERIVSACRAIVYAVLAWTALRIVAGSGTSSAQKQETATATLMSSPGGHWLVGLAGAAVVGFGIGMAVFGLRLLRLPGPLPPRLTRWQLTA